MHTPIVHHSRHVAHAVIALLPAMWLSSALTAQPRPTTTVQPCGLVTANELRVLGLPTTARGVPDSTGSGCRWGSVAQRHALVITHYPAMDTLTLIRMRLAAERTGDPIVEPTVGQASWSVGRAFGRVLMAGHHGQAVQFQYYVAPHSKGADRVDVRATEGDRQALLRVARSAVSRL